MRIFSLLSMIGITSCKAQESNNIQHGNFTIQRKILTEKDRGSVQSRKYETRSYLVEYQVLYRGKKITFPFPLQNESKYNFPWRVYIIKEGPVPALIAGSHNMFLITEENDKAKILRLNHHDAKFGSLQWLDSNNNKPGDEKQVLDLQNDVMLDNSLVLGGGKYLLINRFTVLDVSSLTPYQFNRRNIFEHDGWHLSLETSVGHETAVGFSSQFKQVVFRALKLDPKTDGKYFTALFAFNYMTDSISIVPFSRTDLRIESLDDVNSSWVGNFFEWDTNGKLQIKHNIQPPSWRGKLKFVETDFISYELYPAKESMIAVFLSFIKKKYQSKSQDSVSIIDETDPQSIQITYKVEVNGQVFQLTYNKRDMKLLFDRHFNAVHSNLHREMIIAIGSSFNDELLQQRHQEHFGSYNGDY